MSIHDLGSAAARVASQAALAWVLAQPGVTAPIVGASKPHHLEHAVEALEATCRPQGARGHNQAVFFHDRLC